MDIKSNPVLNQKGPLVINITNLSECYYCRTAPLKTTDVYCPSCGFPQRGTEEEQKKFITNKRIQIIQLESVIEESHKARNALFGVAVLYGISYVMLALKMGAPALIEGGIICGIFAGLGIWANKNAFPAVLTGLLLFLLIIILFAIINPITLFAGILWKAIIISALVYGLKSARKVKELKESLATPTRNLDQSI